MFLKSVFFLIKKSLEVRSNDSGKKRFIFSRLSARTKIGSSLLTNKRDFAKAAGKLIRGGLLEVNLY